MHWSRCSSVLAFWLVLELQACGFPEYDFARTEAAGEGGAAGASDGHTGGMAGATDEPVLAGCNNGEFDTGEADLDCGGGCARKCGPGSLCLSSSDCKSLVCNDDGECAAASCEDDVQNGDESDVDCGGSGECPRCSPLASCKVASDCSSGACANDACDLELRVYYYTQVKGPSSHIRPEIRVENVGASAVALSSLELRYFLSVSGEAAGEDDTVVSENTADISGGSSRSVTGATVWKMVTITPVTDADSYLSISFSSSAGELGAGELLTVSTTLFYESGGTHLQDNDFSFDSSAVQMSQYDRVPLYYDGQLVLGVEPG